MKKISLNLNLLSLFLICSACFPKIKDAQKQLTPFDPPVVPQKFEEGELNAPDANEFFEASLMDSQACEYLKFLRADQARSRRRAFRLFEEIKIQPATRKEPEKVLGYQNLSKNPQILFALSGESNPLSKPLDPPSLDEFIRLAKEKQAKGEVSWGEVKILEILKRTKFTKILAGLRNKAVQSAIEEALPGVFSATAMDLSKSNILTTFFALSSTAKSLNQMGPAQKAALEILSWELPLQVSDAPSERLKDLRATLKVLYAPSKSTGLARTQDDLCRFALSQRLSAQILIEKGFRESPQLERGGYLIREYPRQDRWVYPVQDSAGVYSEILDSRTISRLLESGQSLRPLNATSTAAYLSSMRALVGKMALLRAPQLWVAGEGSSVAMIHPKLIQLQFAKFALQAPLLLGEELEILPGNRLSLREDSLDNLLELGRLSLDLLWVLKGLEEAIPALDNILSESQRESLVGDSESSVKNRFIGLITGVILELNARLAENDYSEQEKSEISDVYVRAARMLGNPVLMRKGLRLRGE
jgi:hypothetical protein